ncbi:uncharacterized protein LOC114135468 [Xiphophorus couchianus]|uniref:uncharacterized protein LOC114135468 n=1 Tax=Xiphophorus couchianus TaxID=32473 RepID=UPI0010162B26|nr:uncharacterized protein LOC114135468 [Xiphophorus couchianus]
MQDIGVPLHRVVIQSELWSGDAVVGVRPSFPIPGVSMILGNDLAGGRVLVTPDVTPVPVLRTCPDELARTFPDVFTSCAVTRAALKRQQEEDKDDLDLSETFLCDAEPEHVPLKKSVEEDMFDVQALSLSRQQLMTLQKTDKSLASLFNDALSDKSDFMSTGYFLNDGVLMCKWTPLNVSQVEEWSVVKQVVVPAPYRPEILRLARDSPLAGHLGIKETYDRILRHVFWPGLKSDVVRYCNSCHFCQVSGKPNQIVPPAPLYPIPAISEPFERVLVDCVGLLPRTKAGNKFLGSNFMSKVFAQVLNQLDIKHRH